MIVGRTVPRPTLVVVSGSAGAGKTTLSHALARALGCPAICRDEIKEGMVRAHPGFVPGPGDALTTRTLSTFFGVLGLLLADGVTVVADAAFQDHVWRPRLEPLAGLATLRIVRCAADPETARARVERRMREVASRAAHDDPGWLRAFGSPWHPIAMDAPTLDVDTTDGYRPAFATIVAFAEGR